MKLRIIIILTAIVAACYISFDPEQTPWMLRCPMYWITGIQCPVCGAQRMLHALLNGEIAAAFKYNAALLLTLPFWCWIAMANLFPNRFPRSYQVLLNTKAVATYLVAAALWMVFRNIYLS